MFSDQVVLAPDKTLEADLYQVVKEALDRLPECREEGQLFTFTVANHEVTLCGVCNCEMLHEVLLSTVSALPGVDAVVDHLRTDRQIEEEIGRAFVSHPDLRLSAKSILVRSENGKVTLQGTVPTREKRVIAISAAYHTNGVRHVVDLLDVPNLWR